MPTWNDQQLKAIQTKEKNILVSASAGSGKTTVLIARLMDLVIKDRIAIDRILAMTFTEAAANEMKKRLAAELQAALHTADSKETEYITKQLTSIQTAHISTIHSFCLSIIQEYYYIIDLHPQRINNIMDNASMVLFQKQALEEAFKQQYEKKDSTFNDLCQIFSARAENDDALSSIVRSLSNLASSKSDRDEWFSTIRGMYQNISSINDLSEEIKINFFAYLYVETTRYDDEIHKIKHFYDTRYMDETKKAVLVDAKMQAIPPLYEALQAHDYEGYRSALFAITHALIPPSPDKEDKQYAQYRKAILDLEDQLLADTFSEDQFIRDMKKLSPFIDKLIEICKDYGDNYARIKEQQKMIDFDDMEHFALAILQANNGQVADAYRELFVEIMVDEFQDSNDVQNLLVNLICRDNNVFRVGDIKQSIYGFRHAKPQLMRGLIEQKGPCDEVIYLSNNYRSKKKIVDFNNELFKILMNIDGFSCRYANEDDVETGVPTQLVDSVPICFHAIFHEEIKEANHIIVSKNELKASYIASQIIEIKEKEQRSWKDFVVLVRSNARKQDMKAIFDELNIPYFIDVKSGFYQSSAVQIILATLKCLSNPDNDIAFTAAMLSPIFKRTVEDLAEAKLQKDKTQSFYHYFLEHPFHGFETFLNLKEALIHNTLCEMLNLLYMTNDYYDQYTTIQEKTNLDLLFDKAIAFEQQYATGIPAFLYQIEQIKDEQTAEAIPIGSEADVVRVMSIHQSKGLQFPVVFLWSTDKMMPVEFKDFCICDSDMGIAMKCMDLPKRYVRTTIPRIAMEHKKDKEELEEEMRILYVATTRAQQQMHIVDCVLSLEPYKQPLTTSAVYNRKGYTSWILQIFFQMESDLFTCKEVHTYWDQVYQAEPVNVMTKQILRYTQPVQKSEFITASAIKKEDDQTFTLQDTKKAVSYGTMMHKMIEHLNTTVWNETSIHNVANQLHFTLSYNDQQTLMELYEQPIFQEALKDNCFYELPFLAKDGDTILHGFIDFVSMHETAILIIDFKTDALQVQEEFITRYKSQLITYKKAMSILYPKHSIQCLIYSLHLNKMISLEED